VSVRDDGFGGFTVGPSTCHADSSPPGGIDTVSLETHYITLVEGEYDWQGLYIDGELVDENHSLGERAVIDACAKGGTRMCSFATVVVKDEWMFDQDHLPTYLSQIPDEAKVQQ
jgi:hypothetical protein